MKSDSSQNLSCQILPAYSSNLSLPRRSISLGWKKNPNQNKSSIKIFQPFKKTNKHHFHVKLAQGHHWCTSKTMPFFAKEKKSSENNTQNQSMGLYPASKNQPKWPRLSINGSKAFKLKVWCSLCTTKQLQWSDWLSLKEIPCKNELQWLDWLFLKEIPCKNELPWSDWLSLKEIPCKNELPW